MTVNDFQETLKNECVDILKEVTTKKTSGESVSGVNGYKQSLPIVTADEEDNSQFFPYVIVRLADGSTETDDDPWVVTADILLGIYDPDTEANGHEHILSMVTKITDRFVEYPLLDQKYRAQQKIQWSLQDEDTYPYYFGGVEIKFELPKTGRRDDYS